MPNKSINRITWVEGELRLAGMDNRMIGLLKAIEKTGSINKAAKQLGFSYKGAWQIIERANNGAPKSLVSTSTGGSKGGGTRLTPAGQALLALFTRLEQEHQAFIAQLNRKLADNPDTRLLLQRLVVKTSASNQLFGRIIRMTVGAVHAEVIVALKGGTQVITTISLALLNELVLTLGADAVLLINSADITLAVEANPEQLSARNCLPGNIIRVHQDDVNAEIVILLPGGEMLTALITPLSAQKLALVPGMPAWAIFKTNAPILGVMPVEN
jgi:molybdate transport system regulatory protein